MRRAEFRKQVLPDQVVPSGKDHETDTNASPTLNPTSWIRSPSGLPQHALASIVQKMAPVEERNWKKVDHPDAYRNESHQID